MQILFVRALALSAVAVLSACGGGGGGSRVMETGASATIRSTIEGLAASADSLLVSDAVGILRERPAPGADPSPPRTFRASPVCRTTTSCSLSVLGATVPVTLSVFQSLDPSLRLTEVGRQQEVPMVEGRSRTTEQGLTTSVLALGGWLDHTFFTAYWEQATGVDGEAEVTFSYSVGDATGTTPLGTATWTGGMAGFDVSSTANNGNRIHGDATLTFDVANTDLDVAFTNVRDMDAGGLHPNMQWANVPVTAGRFGAESRRDYIQGQFYGPITKKSAASLSATRSSGRLGRRGNNPFRPLPAETGRGLFVATLRQKFNLGSILLVNRLLLGKMLGFLVTE